jgi:hypothetical protein
VLDLKIDCLSVKLDGLRGYEDRVAPIAQRAAEILALQVEQRWNKLQSSRSMDAVSAAPVTMDVRDASNEEAAQRIAHAWLQALALKLEV